MVMPLPDCSTRAREGAVGVAGDRKVMDIAHELARKINRSDAFRAVAGPAERNQQRRRVCREIEIWRANKISGGDCLDPARQARREPGRKAFADEGGRACAGQDYPCRRAIEQGAKESFHRVLPCYQPLVRLAQHRRLLRDLARGP